MAILRRLGDIALAIMVALTLSLTMWLSGGNQNGPSCGPQADSATVELTRAATDHTKVFCQDAIIGELREVVPPGSIEAGTEFKVHL